MKTIYLSLALPLLLWGCATGSTVVTGEARPAVTPEAVKIYTDENRPQKFQVIALVSSNGDTKGATVANMKSKAAKVGANGILLERLTANFWEGTTVEGKAIWVDVTPAN